MKKKILYGVILLLLIITCPSCKNKNKDNNVPSVDPVVTPISNSQKLQILKSDLKLTQEQVMSRIKAENIKKNNGYLDTDEIITMVTLDGESLIESYNNRYSVLYKTVSEYANSATGIKQASKIKEEQDLLVEELKEKGINPKLAVIMVGNNSASQIYVRNKSRACDEVGIEFEEY